MCNRPYPDSEDEVKRKGVVLFRNKGEVHCVGEGKDVVAAVLIVWDIYNCTLCFTRIKLLMFYTSYHSDLLMLFISF